MPNSGSGAGGGSVGGGIGFGSGAGFGSSSGTQTTSQSKSGTNKQSGSSSGIISSKSKIASMSPFETNVMGNLGASGSAASPLFDWGSANLMNMYGAGMQPTTAQQKNLMGIRNSTLAADQQGLNFSLMGPGGWLSQVNNQMADRGMTNSSVDTMANQTALENAQNLMNQDVQGANAQYQQGMLTLPYQNANLLTGAMGAGQSQQGIQAGINQNLLNTLTQRDMANRANTQYSLANTSQNQTYNNLLNQTQNWNQTFAKQNNSSGFNIGGSLTGLASGAALGALLL